MYSQFLGDVSITHWKAKKRKSTRSDHANLVTPADVAVISLVHPWYKFKNPHHTRRGSLPPVHVRRCSMHLHDLYPARISKQDLMVNPLIWLLVFTSYMFVFVGGVLVIKLFVQFCAWKNIFDVSSFLTLKCTSQKKCCLHFFEFVLTFFKYLNSSYKNFFLDNTVLEETLNFFLSKGSAHLSVILLQKIL